MRAWRLATRRRCRCSTTASVGAWLITLCRSRAIDRLRARGRRDAALDVMARAAVEGVGDPAPSRAPGPEESADRALRSRRIGAALEALTPGQRRAIELAYYEGLSHSEIASTLSEPLGTVKTRIREGLIILRQRLGAQFET